MGSDGWVQGSFGECSIGCQVCIDACSNPQIATSRAYSAAVFVVNDQAPDVLPMRRVGGILTENGASRLLYIIIDDEGFISFTMYFGGCSSEFWHFLMFSITFNSPVLSS